MKISLSLPDEDVRFLDAYSEDHGLASRSAAAHKAVRLLRAAQLGAAYEAAWAEWNSHPGNRAWDEAVADGLVE